MSTSISKSVLFAAAFHFFTLILILGFIVPKAPKVPDSIFHRFLSGQSPGPMQGDEMLRFKNLIPANESVFFLMDSPIDQYNKDVAQYYGAQSVLAPTLLSSKPGARAAIVYCSNKQIAEKRLSETHYRLLLALADGKGIATKN